MPSVKELVEQYRQGAIEYPQLVQDLASHEYSDLTVEQKWGQSFADVIERGAGYARAR